MYQMPWDGPGVMGSRWSFERFWKAVEGALGGVLGLREKHASGHNGRVCTVHRAVEVGID
jgi:hypothetical protein